MNAMHDRLAGCRRYEAMTRMGWGTNNRHVKGNAGEQTMQADLFGVHVDAGSARDYDRIGGGTGVEK
jgi:hypothetical protein